MPFKLEPSFGVSLYEVVNDLEPENIIDDYKIEETKRYERQRNSYILQNKICFEMPKGINPHIISLTIEDKVAEETLIQTLLERLNLNEDYKLLNFVGIGYSSGTKSERGDFEFFGDNYSSGGLSYITRGINLSIGGYFSGEGKWDVLKKHNLLLNNGEKIDMLALFLGTEARAFTFFLNGFKNEPPCLLYLQYDSGELHFVKGNSKASESELEEKLIGLVDGVLGKVIRE